MDFVGRVEVSSRDEGGGDPQWSQCVKRWLVQSVLQEEAVPTVTSSLSDSYVCCVVSDHSRPSPWILERSSVCRWQFLGVEPHCFVPTTEDLELVDPVPEGLGQNKPVTCK